VELLVGESQQTGGSVINEIDEDVVVGSTLECFARSSVGGVPDEDLEEVFRCYVLKPNQKSIRTWLVSRSWIESLTDPL